MQGIEGILVDSHVPPGDTRGRAYLFAPVLDSRVFGLCVLPDPSLSFDDPVNLVVVDPLHDHEVGVVEADGSGASAARIVPTTSG